ncbi:MAG TPA: hypothetical protein VGS21_11590 [Acidimicrobiales bacterium]|nr:hypothetical protein [Acidimicrobiales bacterium]
MGKHSRTLVFVMGAFAVAAPLSVLAPSGSPQLAGALGVWAQSRLPVISAPAGYVAAVSCPTTNYCEAVGYFGGVAKPVVMAELWNGTSWSVQPMAKPADARLFELYGVSCASADACTAVGVDATGSSSGPLAESWNGTDWQVEPTSGVPGVGFQSVSCITADSCEAVGDYLSGAGAVAATWDGTSWSLPTMPGLSGGMDAYVASVSCSAISSCEAVGEYYKTVNDQEVGLAWLWNGTSWAAQILPSQGGSSDYPFSLSGVSCVSGGTCWAVGSYTPVGGATAPLAIYLDAGIWTDVTMAEPEAELSAVSCSGSVCEAVGNAFPGNGEVPVAVELDGAEGTAQAIPGPTGVNPLLPLRLAAVSCVNASSCQALGGYNGIPLAEQWNGSVWALGSIPAATATVSTSLKGISCTSATACEAVGSYSLTGTYPLAESWNGSKWTRQHVPLPAGVVGAELSSVSCPAVGDCEAVGYTIGNGTIPFAEQWNGSKWSAKAVEVPNDSSELISISCAGPLSCEAVGSAGSARGVSGLLAEDWDGSTWRRQADPNSAAQYGSFLTAVSCTANGSCEAVGGEWTNAADTTSKVLAEQLNGSSWTFQAPSDPSGTDSGVFDGLSCFSSSTCEAVGSSATSSSAPSAGLAEAWNGTSWTVQVAANVNSAHDNSLAAITCTAANACVAVGSYGGTGSRPTIAEELNGTTWTVDSTPTLAGSERGGLAAVVCVAGTSAQCIAAGYDDKGAGSISLVESD